jgi:hypothetical protein
LTVGKRQDPPAGFGFAKRKFQPAPDLLSNGAGEYRKHFYKAATQGRNSRRLYGWFPPTDTEFLSIDLPQRETAALSSLGLFDNDMFLMMRLGLTRNRSTQTQCKKPLTQSEWEHDFY